MQVTLKLIIVQLLLVQFVIAQKATSDLGLEDYGPESESDLKDSNGNKPLDGNQSGGVDDGGNKLNDEPLEEEDKSKTKFSDERFAKLFPNRGANRSFMAKNVAKPKPTLPSFIKSTPPLLKAQVHTTPSPRGGQRSGRLGQGNQATTSRRTGTSTTTVRPRSNRINGLNNQLSQNGRQLSGRLSTSAPVRSTTSSSTNPGPSAAALAASRRLRQGSGISRFQRTNNSASVNNNNNNNQQQLNNNSTIPALNPRRN